MTVLKYQAVKDTVITNAYQRNLQTRATGSNLGASDVLEVFSIFAQASTSSYELARILIEFDTETMLQQRNLNLLPDSGSVSFYLRMFDAPNNETTPRDFTLQVAPISGNFEEGVGMDMENYTDITRDELGANWVNRASGSLWVVEGGDYLTSVTSSQTFSEGGEDLEIDITPIVEEWLNGGIANAGVGVFLTSTLESGQLRSYYTKRFFGRGTEFFFKRPVIEARWDGAVKDNRGNFIVSSSLLTAEENLNTLYLYNQFRGTLRDIPSVGQGTLSVDVFPEASGSTASINAAPITAGWASTGTYTATFALETTEELVYDVWYSGANVFYTGTVETQTFQPEGFRTTSRRYVASVPNLKETYSYDENARIRLFTRRKDFTPNLFTVASGEIQKEVLEDVYFSIERVVDGLVVIPYGTGSTNHTRLSYDVSGNYFDFSMDLLEPGYAYRLKFVVKDGENFEELNEKFKFKLSTKTY